jgi:hypothetical protein
MIFRERLRGFLPALAFVLAQLAAQRRTARPESIPSLMHAQ